MLEKVCNSTRVHQFKNTPVANRIKNSILIRMVKQSAGDWRYPFMLFSWWLSKLLVPRRKISINDVSFTLSCTNWITHFRWYLFKNKEPEVRYYIDRHVKNNDIFFDIGANVGVFSVYAGKRHPDISVYCFEPEFSNLNALKDNIVCNSLQERTRIYSVGISDFVGLSELHVQNLSTGAAAHTESKTPITVTDEGYPVVWSEGIISVTLDYICEQIGVVPNSIKIDTDGNEAKILNGAAKTLTNKNLRSLVIEMPSDETQRETCCRILTSAGFRLEEHNFEKSRNEIWLRE